MTPGAAGAAAGSVSPDQAAELWRMLGLEEDGGAPDAGVLALLLRVVRDVQGDQRLAESLARGVGQHASRLAMWQALELVERLRDTVGPHTGDQLLDRFEADVAPALEQLLLEVWRRHLGLALRWRTDRAEEAHRLVLTVGFVDMVGWTSLAAGLDGAQVTSAVRAFERICVETVLEHRGRVVKSLGDGLLFVADEVGTGVRTGLDLAERFASSPDLPDVRVGLATGPVSAALGDVHGSTVNRAARLTEQASPGAVVVDSATAERAAADPELQTALRPLPRVQLRGLGDVALWEVLRDS